MIAKATAGPRRASRNAQFLAMLPAIRRQARFAFRDLPPESRDDAIAEVIADCFVAFSRLCDQGRANQAFPTVLAGYAIRHYRAGRRVGVKTNSHDVGSRAARLKHEHKMRHLGAPAEQYGGWKEQLVENSVSPIPDQAAFRIDFPNWLGTLSRRNRGVAESLAAGEGTHEVSRTFKISPGRVSQLRRILHDAWEAFHGEDKTNTRGVEKTASQRFSIAAAMT